MKQNTNVSENFHKLRQQAEEFLTNHDVTYAPPVLEDPAKLIHELQTFRIELELQNEELHRSQQELLKSNKQFTELYDFAPVGYLTVNMKGGILNANLTLADMLLIERSSLTDQPLSGLIIFEDQDIFYRHMRNLTDVKSRQICELRMKKKDGTPLDVQLESTVFSYQNGKLEQYRIVVIDISARKQAEKERENLQKLLYQAHKMKSIATVAGGVAHDFNNILNIIFGNIELLMEDIQEYNPLYRKLDVIKTATLRASGVVKMLLNFSRKTDQDQKPLGVVSAINETYQLLRSLIPATIDIQMSLPDTEVMILADQIQFGQILFNLCTNATQAMEKTGGIIEIKVETQSLPEESVIHYPGLKAGNYVKITVNDNGPGIDPEIMDQIFDPYFTTREAGKGSGMGLAVVHNLVKNHNGTITVTGQPGKGAFFTMLFPMIDESPELRIATTEESFHGKERILFVDDEVAIAQIAKEILQIFGYRVEAVSDSEDALALFKLNPGYFDIVVTDMTMPNMTGTQLAEAIRRIRPNTPIIICTGYSALIDEDRAGQLGITGYLEKPISMSDIAKTIRQIMDK